MLMSLAHVSNAQVLQQSGLSAIADILRHRRLSLFGHVAHLDPGMPAHLMDIYEGRKPMASCIRPPGRPHHVWLNKVQEDANVLPLSTLWRSEIAGSHGAAQRSTQTTQRRRRILRPADWVSRGIGYWLYWHTSQKINRNDRATRWSKKVFKIGLAIQSQYRCVTD